MSTLPTNPEATGLKLTEPRKKKFLDLLEKTGNASTAAAQLGVSYSTIKSHASKDLYFKECIEIAQAKFLGALEEEAMNRAVTGEMEDVWYQGEVVGQKKVKSDKILEMLLKANSEKYTTKGQSTTNNTLIIDSGSSTVDALTKFLGVDVNKKDPENASEPSEGDIIDGEYSESDDS